MSTDAKAELHRLVDALPEREVVVARRVLEALSAPPQEEVMYSLEDAPLDDEPTTPEEEVYVQELCWILNQIASTLDGLTESQLNWAPATGRANSARAIASHVVGSTRVYALGFGCGQLVERDRPAEFAASAASGRELISTIQQLSDEIGSALATLKPSMLDRRIRPSQQLWGTGEPREISGREAIVESISTTLA